jgi:SAM-dependent methyltransferase
MMFGTHDPFTYLACAACGCLELLNRPADLSRYYPPNYYSTSNGRIGLWLRYWLSPSMSRYWLGRGSLVGYLLCRGRQRPPILEFLRRRGVRKGSQLLDVGSGVGHLLFFLRQLGFRRLVGVDPFIEADLAFPGRISVVKGRLSQVAGSFDYVVMNHSFEHMDAPLEVLKQARSLLAPDGQLIISTPIASSFAWREYGANWVQLDPPRHLFIHTVKSIEILARQAGLRVAEVVYDSYGFQFWGSEQYRAGIPLADTRSYALAPKESMFNPEQLAQFERRSAELNAAADGDSASFYLEAISSSSRDEVGPGDL